MVNHVDIYETCLPRGYMAKCRETKEVFNRTAKENQNQFIWRIIKHLGNGIITYYN